jgi:carbon catabolite-derepressing protein kinase
VGSYHIPNTPSSPLTLLYLTPLPPPPGPVLSTLSLLVIVPKSLDFNIIDGLGMIEEDIVDELMLRVEGVDREAIWECLRNDGVQANTVKVAYMLLRDKQRDCELLLTFYFP